MNRRERLEASPGSRQLKDVKSLSPPRHTGARIKYHLISGSVATPCHTNPGGKQIRKLFRAALAATVLFSISAYAVPASATTRVIDGDTLVIGSETIRILNVDTPEIRHAQCDAERRLGLVAKHRLEQLIKGEAIGVLRGDGRRMKDRYGRTLARLTVKGQDVGEILVVEGLARRWDGKRHPWCE